MDLKTRCLIWKSNLEAIHATNQAYKNLVKSIKKQDVVLEDKPDAFKESYIVAAIAFANADNEINAQELNRLYSLMTRLSTTSELRQKMIQEKLDESDFPFALDRMESQIDHFELKAIYTLLAKDILVISGTLLQNFDDQQSFCMNELKRRSGLTAAAISLIQDDINFENSYIAGKINDTQFINGIKKRAKEMTAVGIPVSELYLSGSTIGISAKPTPAKQLREVADKANKRMISALIDDMNCLSKKISILVDQQATNQAMVKRLTMQLAKLKDAFKAYAEQNEITLV